MVHKHTFFFVILCMVSLIMLIASGCGKKNDNPHPDISDVPKQEVSIMRLEKMMSEANASNYQSVFAKIEEAHPEIFSAYYRNFWGLYKDDTTVVYNVYDSLFSNTLGNEWMSRLNDTISVVYAKMDDVETEIEQAYRYFKYYFPDSSLPQLYTYTGPFVYQTLFDDQTMGIELDMYMGQHFGYYGNFENNMPQYLTFRFDRPFISLNVMRSLMDGNIPVPGMEISLLDAMLREGKMLYYLDCVLPDMADSIKMGYTAAQIEWADDNEAEIWKFLAGEELLFSKRTDDHRRYLDEAPTSVGMPDEAPGRVAIWTGWQIVRAYMKENPETDLLTLFYEMDAIKLLKMSGYNPED